MLEPSDALFASPVPTSSTKLALRPFLRRVYPDIPVELNRGAFASACTGEAATDAAEASASCSSGRAPPPPMFDVRSPAEYAHGHIPGALTLPLFNDDERAQVGTCFKNSGRFAAIQLGLALVGPKLARCSKASKHSLARSRAMRSSSTAGVVMRSSSVCWMLNLCGLSFKPRRRLPQLPAMVSSVDEIRAKAAHKTRHRRSAVSRCFCKSDRGVHFECQRCEQHGPPSRVRRRG